MSSQRYRPEFKDEGSKELESENAQLKHMASDQALDIRVLKGVNGKIGEPGRAAALRDVLEDAARGQRTARFLPVHRQIVST